MSATYRSVRISIVCPARADAAAGGAPGGTAAPRGGAAGARWRCGRRGGRRRRRRRHGDRLMFAFPACHSINAGEGEDQPQNQALGVHAGVCLACAVGAVCDARNPARKVSSGHRIVAARMERMAARDAAMASQVPRARHAARSPRARNPSSSGRSGSSRRAAAARCTGSRAAARAAAPSWRIPRCAEPREQRGAFRGGSARSSARAHAALDAHDHVEGFERWARARGRFHAGGGAGDCDRRRAASRLRPMT